MSTISLPAELPSIDPSFPSPVLCPTCGYLFKDSIAKHDECPSCHVQFDKVSAWYSPWPKQIQFHTNLAKFRLEVGGYGSGKSKPLLIEAIAHAIEYPGSESIILRKTIPDLKRTVISKFEADIPRRMYHHYNQSDHTVFFHPQPFFGKVVQSKLYFAGCERDEDVGRFLSTEFIFVGFEELGEFSFRIFSALSDRCRCPIPGSRPCVAGATNPLGVGWGWIKRLFIDHVPLLGTPEGTYEPKDYWFIHSWVHDNPIYSQDTAYIRQLKSSPIAKKIYEGSLETVSGQYFANWQPERHVRKRDEFTFHKWQSYTIGWDYGFGHFAAIIWLTKALLKPQPRFGWTEARLVNVVTREWVYPEKTPKQQAEALITLVPRNQETGEILETVDSVHLSWERFNRTVSNFTVADEIGGYLTEAGLPAPTRSNTDRVAGWQKIYSLLESDELFILDECTYVIDSLPLLVRDPIKLEDVVKPKGVSLADDVCDGLRYAIAGALLSPDELPAEEKFRQRLSEIKDPFRRHVEQYREWMRQQKPQTKPNVIPSWRNRLDNK